MSKSSWSEEARLKELASYEILDTPYEEEFDDIVKLASQICDTPISIINLVDADRQWFKAEIGFGIRETPLDNSICAQAILQNDLFVVPDTTKDPCFKNNPLVMGEPNLRFYTGALLKTSEGLPLGTLCVLDYKPRELNEEQKSSLKALARQVMSQIELRRALKEKQNVENQVGLVFNSPEFTGFWSWDLESNLLVSEQRFAAMYGVDPELALNGAPLEEYTKNIDPDDLARITPSIERTVLEGADYEEEYRINQSDGQVRWVSARGTVQLNSDGKPIRFDGVAIDITEKKELEETTKQALKNAEMANMAKTEFLANMSHEIRTPMNAIIGLSNILSKSENLKTKDREFLRVLQTSADGLLALVNDLLDIAKIEARSVDLEETSFCMAKLIQAVISMMAVRVKEKGLTFAIEDDCIANRNFIGDPSRIRQILLNLCSNAIKFTEKGNVQINITCEDSDDPSIENIHILVTDTGIGIAPNKLDNIFEKFNQADASINRKYGGTGLGLAITKNLITAMGGTISVESKLGKGSKFKVILPLLKSQEGLNTEIITKDVKKLSNKKNFDRHILLVEDYEPNALVAQTFLEDFGYNVEIAVNGNRAVEKIKTGKFALVLMDVQMHGMNGLDATEAVRNWELKENRVPIPIIGITAHALAGDRERCIAAGMNDYISKPFVPEELESKIGAYIAAI